MKNIKFSEAIDQKQVCRELVEALKLGQIVCLPCGGRYRLLVDITNEAAVIDLLQAKGRIHKAPSLVFVASEAALTQVTAEVDPLAQKLAHALWPRSLTLLVTPHPELPRVIAKQLAAAGGKIGVRMPMDMLVKEVALALGRPLLVSSANKENKGGETSPAQVRKNFVNSVAVFVDKGDLRAEPLSTIVDVVDGKAVVTREGPVPVSEVMAIV